jgi:hypothetical protein
MYVVFHEATIQWKGDRGVSSADHMNHGDIQCVYIHAFQ